MADTMMAGLCTLCYSTYNVKHPSKIPRRLQCRHTFCNECIKKLQDLQGQAIECPLCQEPTLLPSEGIEGLDKNLEALGLDHLEIEPEKCQHCIHKVYPPRPATLFCNDCEALFCGSCSDAEHLKPENTRHSVILESAKSSDKFARGSSVSSRQLDSSWSRPATGSRSGRSSSVGLTSRSSSSLILEQDSIPECPEHGEKMKIYCRTDRCLCCSYCEAIGIHKGHDCFKVHEAEEKERVDLQRLQQKVDLHSERFIKARGDVQQMIEDVKKNSIGVKDTVRRYMREMRAAIDATEKTLLVKLTKRSEANLKALREQLSKMINISSLAKTASRNCDNALSYDYYEMLLRRRPVEEEMKKVLEMMVATEPMAKADLHCQFPKHESLLNSIRTCPYIVEAPPAPSNFTCSMTQEGNIALSWDDNDNIQFIYPPIHYIIQASIGPDNCFIDVKSTKLKCHTVVPKDSSFLQGMYVQFRVCAENIVEKGPFCNPFGIKVPVSNRR